MRSICIQVEVLYKLYAGVPIVGLECGQKRGGAGWTRKVCHGIVGVVGVSVVGRQDQVVVRRLDEQMPG